MTWPRASPGKLRRIAAWEYVLRFAAGGAITAITGLIAKRWGPAVGGLFLAFPAILPASLTLVKQHDGRRRALDDARGSQVGTIALAGFAACATLTAPRWPPAVFLPVATAVWLVVAVVAWRVLLAGRS
jgi:Protein of unknown function (DUF3147)